MPVTSTTPPESPSPVRYATFTRRFRALMVDTAVVGAILIAVVLLSDAASNVPGSGRVAWVLIFVALLFYEPILVSWRGATIGHAMNQLCVVDTRSGGFPSLARAFVRFLIKTVLGLPSFVSMALTRKHQAVHDLITRTTVQVPLEEDTVEFHTERAEESELVLPSRLRRGAMIIVYLVIVFFVYVALVVNIDPTGCPNAYSCPADARITIGILALIWVGLSIATIVAGWKGLLYGARRSSRATSTPEVVAS